MTSGGEVGERGFSCGYRMGTLLLGLAPGQAQPERMLRVAEPPRDTPGAASALSAWPGSFGPGLRTRYTKPASCPGQKRPVHAPPQVLSPPEP